MLRSVLFASVLAGCVAFAGPGATAQAVIHAVTGTVTSVDSTGKTINVLLDNGSRSVFSELNNPKTRISYDKHLLDDTISGEAFDKKDAYAIIFYIGERDQPTAVALRTLGAGPFTSAIGEVTAFSGKDHSISVKDKTGAVQTFKLTTDTVAEGNLGAVPGAKFSADKGDHVRIVGAAKDGNPIAVFVSEM